jgi:signal transduction histidine kinase
VTVRSVEGAGSTFTLYIPLRSDHASTVLRELP